MYSACVCVCVCKSQVTTFFGSYIFASFSDQNSFHFQSKIIENNSFFTVNHALLYVRTEEVLFSFMLLFLWSKVYSLSSNILCLVCNFFGSTNN